MNVFLDPKKLETVNTTNSTPLKNSTSLRIIVFRGENRRGPLWHFHVLRHFVHVCIQKVPSLFPVSLLKGLICIRCVSGVGDAKSPAMSEIWLSPGPFFFQAPRYYTVASSILCMEELAVWRWRKKRTIIVMASWAQCILIVFPEQKLICVYNMKWSRNVREKKSPG